MVHYSGVSIVDFKQVNISFQKLIPEKSRKVTYLTIQKAPTRKSFKGDHWILPELKPIFTQTNHKKSLISLMADIALRYTAKTKFANLHKIPFI